MRLKHGNYFEPVPKDLGFRVTSDTEAEDDDEYAITTGGNDYICTQEERRELITLDLRMRHIIDGILARHE